MNSINIRKFLFDTMLIFGVILLAYIAYSMYNKDNTLLPDQIKQSLAENKKIQDKIDSINDYNKSLVKLISSLEGYENEINMSINRNNLLIKENNNKLDKIKKIYEKRIDSVNNYSIYQLDSFFTKRYP
jgi:peptidoglycan hydrolase CwlO-like protein